MGYALDSESRGLNGTATSTGSNFDSSIKAGILRSVTLAAGTATASMQVTDVSGNVGVILTAPANSSAQRLFVVGLMYQGPLTVASGGALAGYDLEVG